MSPWPTAHHCPLTALQRPYQAEVALKLEIPRLLTVRSLLDTEQKI
jgi:hypothetical protein